MNNDNNYYLITIYRDIHPTKGYERDQIETVKENQNLPHVYIKICAKILVVLKQQNIP